MTPSGGEAKYLSDHPRIPSVLRDIFRVSSGSYSKCPPGHIPCVPIQECLAPLMHFLLYEHITVSTAAGRFLILPVSIVWGGGEQSRIIQFFMHQWTNGRIQKAEKTFYLEYKTPIWHPVVLARNSYNNRRVCQQ